MNVYQKYEKLEIASRQIEEKKAELREEINTLIKREEEPVTTTYGRFVKITKKIWTYTPNFLKDRAKKEKEIKEIKSEIKEMETRAQVLNKATLKTEVGFRFEVAR